MTVPDDEAHEEFERIDGDPSLGRPGEGRSYMLGATAAMLGDWDLQSTLLRRPSRRAPALFLSTAGEGRGSFLATDAAAMARYERRLLVASRTSREDAVGRYLLPILEELATEKLMETGVRPAWLVQAALAMTVAAAFCFSRGWHWAPLPCCSFDTARPGRPAAGNLRLRPLSPSMLSRRLLWPAAGLALLALGWFEARHGSGWGAMVAALAGAHLPKPAGPRRRPACRRANGIFRAATPSGSPCRSPSAAGGAPIWRVRRSIPRQASSSPSIFGIRVERD